MKKIAAALLAVCLLVGLTACKSAPVTDGASLTDDGRESGGYVEGKIGDRLVNEFFAFTVLSAEKATEYEGYTPAEGNMLIVADIKVENVFGDTVPMFSSDFQVQWGEGDEDYDYPVDKFADGLMEDEYELEKKGTVTAKVVYELPAIAEKQEYSISYLEIYEDDLEGNVYFVYFEL